MKLSSVYWSKMYRQHLHSRVRFIMRSTQHSSPVRTPAGALVLFLVISFSTPF
jgi:hypothetical protein